MKTESKATVGPLLVSRGWRYPGLPDGCQYLDYDYRDISSPYGPSAWRDGGDVFVSASCRSLNGGFRQQALNSMFAKMLLSSPSHTVLVVGLEGASLDLLRICGFLGATCSLVLDGEKLEALEPNSKLWLHDCLAKCEAIYVDPENESYWKQQLPGIELRALPEQFPIPDTKADAGFDYASYEFCLRDHPLLCKMQTHDVAHFEGCNKVLDVGCGAGIFLQLLAEKGIQAVGAERDPKLTAYGQGMGLDIREADALEYLRDSEEQFDGIYCSHFVEHLPFELVHSLLALLCERLAPGGRLVLTFPDPESIRSQLLGFWRDPEHVRFYHPELISTLASSLGMQCEWSSYEAQPHEVIPFAAVPEPIELAEPLGEKVTQGSAPSIRRGGMLKRIANALGLATNDDVSELTQRLRESEAALQQQANVNQQLLERTDSLWKVNQTWAWNDNVTLRFRK